MKVSYNSPIILTLSFISILIFIASIMNEEVVYKLSCPATFSQLSLPNLYRILTYPFVHANGANEVDFSHLFGNFSIILLLGPLIEKEEGSLTLFILILINAIFAAIIHIVLSDSHLIGASGIAFMLIAMASMGNLHKGKVPMTFLLVAMLYFTSEIYGLLLSDGISHITHLSGAFLGAFYSFRKVNRQQGQL